MNERVRKIFHYFHSSRIVTVYNEIKEKKYSECRTQNYGEVNSELNFPTK
jgi:hypothetical protein